MLPSVKAVKEACSGETKAAFLRTKNRRKDGGESVIERDSYRAKSLSIAQDGDGRATAPVGELGALAQTLTLMRLTVTDVTSGTGCEQSVIIPSVGKLALRSRAHGACVSVSVTRNNRSEGARGRHAGKPVIVRM